MDWKHLKFAAHVSLVILLITPAFLAIIDVVAIGWIGWTLWAIAMVAELIWTGKALIGDRPPSSTQGPLIIEVPRPPRRGFEVIQESENDNRP